MKYLGPGECSYRLLFPFCVPIFSYLRGLVDGAFEFKTKNNAHPFFMSFLAILCNVILGLPYIISKCFKKHKLTHTKGTKKHYLTLFKMIPIQNDGFTKDKLKTYFFVLLSSGIVSIALPTFAIVNYSESNPLLEYKTSIFLIFFNVLFTYLILGSPIYKHHYLSLGFILVAIGLCCFNDFANITWQVMLSCLLVNLLISIAYISEKWLMDVKQLNPYQLLFYLGCCSICIYVLLFIILYLIPCTPAMQFCESITGDEPVENVIQLLASLSGNDYLLCVGYLVVFGLYLLFCILTLYYLSPVHHCISEIITIMLYWVIKTIKGNLEWLWYIHLVGYILMLVSALVCNELIIIKICGLDQNTKIEINKRSKNELYKNAVNNDCFDVELKLDDTYLISEK